MNCIKIGQHVVLLNGPLANVVMGKGSILSRVFFMQLEPSPPMKKRKLLAKSLVSSEQSVLTCAIICFSDPASFSLYDI